MLKKNQLCLLVSFLALAPSALQGISSYSLLFTPQEVDTIREYLEGGGDISASIPEATIGVIHLSAIMFMDAQNWTVWLNDQIIHAGDLLDSLPFQIKKVTPHDVTFQWETSRHSSQSVKLRAGETYHPTK